jgi:hypothetical protein
MIEWCTAKAIQLLSQLEQMAESDTSGLFLIKNSDHRASWPQLGPEDYPYKPLKVVSRTVATAFRVFFYYTDEDNSVL